MKPEDIEIVEKDNNVLYYYGDKIIAEYDPLGDQYVIFSNKSDMDCIVELPIEDGRDVYEQFRNTIIKMIKPIETSGLEDYINYFY